MLKQKAISKYNRIGLVLLTLALILSPFVAYYNPFVKQSKAIGGGWITGNTNSVTTNATTNTISGQNDQRNNPANIDGTYIVILASSFSAGITVSSVSDTVGDTYHFLVGSHVKQDAEIWVANYTKTNFAANTVTVTFSSSTESTLRAYFLTGVTATTNQTAKNDGTATTMSVPSFTPTNNFACINWWSLDTGSTSAPTYTIPNFWYSNFGQVLAGSSLFKSGSVIDNNWAGFGATTVSVGYSPSSSPKWDDVVGCFDTSGGVGSTTTTTTSVPTSTTSTTTTTTLTSTTSFNATTTTTTTNGMSAGIVQEKQSTTVAGTSNSVTMDYNPERYNLLVDQVFIFGNGAAKTPTDNNGLTWTSLTSIAGNFKIYWFAVNFSVASTTETITQNLTASAQYQFRVFELTGISSNWASSGPQQENNICQSAGCLTTASVTSITPPTNWLVLSAVDFQAGDTSAHAFTTFPLSEYNLGLSTMQSQLASSQNWTISSFYPMWNLGVSTFPTVINSATTPHWAIQVLFLPTQTNGIVTNTITSTSYSPTVTSTLISTTTNFTTTTETVIPEPAGSTDLVALLIGITIMAILFGIAMYVQNFGWLPAFLSGTIGLVMFVAVEQNQTLVYGNNTFLAPTFVLVMLGLFVLGSWVLGIYKAIRR